MSAAAGNAAADVGPVARYLAGHPAFAGLSAADLRELAEVAIGKAGDIRQASPERAMSAQPAFTSLSREDLLGDYALGHEACRKARLNAPTWQEIATAERGPAVSSRPARARPGSVRAGTARRGRGDLLHDVAPHALHLQAREEFQRALLAGAVEALKRGGQVAAIHANPNGTFEVSDVRIPPIFPKKQDNADTVPARRPALRLVKGEHHPPVREGSTRRTETSSLGARGRSQTRSSPAPDRGTAAPTTG